MIRFLVAKPCPRCGGPVPLPALLNLSALAGIFCTHCGVELRVSPLVRIGVVLLSLAAAEAVDWFPPGLDYLGMVARPALLAGAYVVFTCLFARLRASGQPA